jgi:hypothetical protein
MNIQQAIYEATGKSLLELVLEQSEFSQKTFGTDEEKGPEGPLKHLLEEVQEVLDDSTDVMEYADCFLLLLDATRRAEINIHTLLRAAHDKLEINKKRTWEKTSEGYSKHVNCCSKHQKCTF